MASHLDLEVANKAILSLEVHSLKPKLSEERDRTGIERHKRIESQEEQEEMESLDLAAMMTQILFLIILTAQDIEQFLKSQRVVETNIRSIRLMWTKILVGLISLFLPSKKPKRNAGSRLSVTR
jgi:hypothetical protein